MVINCSLMKSITNDCDPTGMPRSRNPSVNSIGVGCDGFNLFGFDHFCRDQHAGVHADEKQV